MAGSPTTEAEIRQPACTESESEPELDADPPHQGVKVARRNTVQ
jgi:hypothetical protein